MGTIQVSFDIDTDDALAKLTLVQEVANLVLEAFGPPNPNVDPDEPNVRHDGYTGPFITDLRFEV